MPMGGLDCRWDGRLGLAYIAANEGAPKAEY